MFNSYMWSPLTQTGPSSAALQPAPAELQRRPAQSWCRLRLPAPACATPSLSFWLLGVEPVKERDKYVSTFKNNWFSAHRRRCLEKILHLKLSEDCRCIIGDKQLLQVVDDHFIHTWNTSDCQFNQCFLLNVKTELLISFIEFSC